MCDAWDSMVEVAEQALQAFMDDLPSNYRRRQIFNRPDLVWGERVLVNFRYTQDCLDRAFINLTHGNISELRWAGNVKSDFAGFIRDNSTDWMIEPPVKLVYPDAEENFRRFLSLAAEKAFNIDTTLNNFWFIGAFSTRYVNSSLEPFNAPGEWPLYRKNEAVKVVTGTVVTHTGIYLPEIADSVAAFMIRGQPAPQAAVGYDSKRMRESHRMPTSWVMVERVSDSGGGASPSEIRLRCDAGQPYPRTGYWFTPAQSGSRRHFQAGETMPAFQSAWGVTIWQWDTSQEP